MTVIENPRSATPSRPLREKRQNKQYLQRRHEIVDLAAELFATSGYAATGIREIGEAAQLARGALYYYIDSKESLLEEIHNRVLDPLLASAREIVSSDEPAEGKLRKLSRVLLGEIITRQHHVWVFLHEYRALTGERRLTFRRKRSEFEQCIASILRQGAEDGDFEIENIDATMLAFLGMHNYTYQWVRSTPGLDPEVLSRRYCDLLLKGISRSD